MAEWMSGSEARVKVSQQVLVATLGHARGRRSETTVGTDAKWYIKSGSDLAPVIQQQGKV
ncbi:hypothetical protein CEB3_c24680 [Peptococcaceae bacterium CEB3]|nr:hypothetical protein CEB3_c24680 [Peptococcaceae bacterium CEB3]